MTGVAIGRRVDVTAVVGSLAAVTALAWVLTVQIAAGMNMPVEPMAMSSAAMAGPDGRVLLMLAMWAAMMVGMMVPSATPMVIAYTRWTRRGPDVGSRATAIALFLSGYVIVWLAFSVLAAVTQFALERAGLLSAMGTTGPAVGGVVLILAGIFQLTPAKEACLARCRTPVGFLIAEWRPGPTGGLVMGLRHGVYCLGCCWALMAVLFVVGTMHLVWMAAIAVFVLAEKITPAALRFRYVSAVAMIGWGAVSVATAV